MAKPTISFDNYSAIKRESQLFKEMAETEGFGIFKQDLMSQMEQIQTLLVENRLRDIHEEITTSDGSKRVVITTAETQRAENAGMYKMAQRMLKLIDDAINYPDRLAEAERRGDVIIQQPKEPKQ